MRWRRVGLCAGVATSAQSKTAAASVVRMGPVVANVSSRPDAAVPGGVRGRDRRQGHRLGQGDRRAVVSRGDARLPSSAVGWLGLGVWSGFAADAVVACVESVWVGWQDFEIAVGDVGAVQVGWRWRNAYRGVGRVTRGWLGWLDRGWLDAQVPGAVGGSPHDAVGSPVAAVVAGPRNVAVETPGDGGQSAAYQVPSAGRNTVSTSLPWSRSGSSVVRCAHSPASLASEEDRASGCTGQRARYSSHHSRDSSWRRIQPNVEFSPI